MVATLSNPSVSSCTHSPSYCFRNHNFLPHPHRDGSINAISTIQNGSNQRNAKSIHRHRLRRSSYTTVSVAAASAAETLLPPQAKKLTLSVGGRDITLETGEIGRQAAGAIMATDGETMIYTTVCNDNDNAGDGSFAPLQINYAERFSAAGRTSGGYLKREARPKDHEVLVARLVDRPIRPMIASGWTHSTQILQWVMSYDGQHATEPLAITAAGAALAVSHVPMKSVVAGVRVGLLPGGRGYVVNPTVEEMEESRLDLIVAGTAEAVLMIEGFCDFLTEEEMLEAVKVGQEAVAGMCRSIAKWAEEVGSPKQVTGLVTPPEGLDNAIAQLATAELENAYRTITLKQERGEAVGALKYRILEQIKSSSSSNGNGGSNSSGNSGESSSSSSPVYDDATLAMAWKRIESSVMRQLVLKEGIRADGRSVDQVRPIWSRADVLARTHGSALFTRGETQALAVTTLGCRDMVQRVDAMTNVNEQYRKDEGQRFYLQYFFPPSSVGETGRVGAPGRREVGHGNLAERALVPVIPGEEEFPYTIRVESTITESNGSSSMASVCGGCLAMLDAGVPLKKMVAGVAMGLILEPSGEYVVLTDILGSEDALGDMDFKVAGDEHSISAFQLDIKVEGITLDIMKAALAAAKKGRTTVLQAMAGCDPSPRKCLSTYAPRIKKIGIPADKVGMVIGPGGKTIRSIEESTGAELDVDGDNCRVYVKAYSDAALNAAVKVIEGMTQEMEVGLVFKGAKVVGVVPFGAFVEIAPGRDGLVHVSEWEVGRVKDMTAVVKEGDLVDVQVIEIADSGKVKLSRRVLMSGGGGGNGNGSEEKENVAPAGGGRK